MFALIARWLLVYVLFVATLGLGGTSLHLYSELRHARDVGTLSSAYAASPSSTTPARDDRAGEADAAARLAAEHSARQSAQLLEVEREARRQAEQAASDAREKLVREQHARIRAEATAIQWKDAAATEVAGRRTAEERLASLDATLALMRSQDEPRALTMPGALTRSEAAPPLGPDARRTAQTPPGRRLKTARQAAPDEAPSLSDQIFGRD